MGIFDRIFGGRKTNGPIVPPRQVGPELLREPAIWLKRTTDLTTVSRLGGLPSLPHDIEWPRQTVTGTPLHFLAQIDLAALPPTPLEGAIDDARLPTAGILYFFADIEEEMLWGFDDRGDQFASTRVIYARKAGPDRDAPDDIPQIGHSFGERDGGYARGLTAFPARPVLPYVIDSYPTGYNDEARELTLQSIEQAVGHPVAVMSSRATREETNKHSAYRLEIRDADGTLRRRESRIALHQMLGAATHIQNEAAAARDEGRVLLLQIDSDYGVDDQFMFCDGGMAQFWIMPEDLSAGRFDRAWATTEGG